MGSEALGRVIEAGIQGWVKALGKPVRGEGPDWLAGPTGGPWTIGTESVGELASARQLEVRRGPDIGLIPDFGVLRGVHFDPDRIDPRVRRFYEQTGRYRLALEVAWSPPFLPPVWALVSFVGRSIDQLNLPLSSAKTRAGITNEVVHLVDRTSNDVVLTGWLRRLRSTGAVMYAGFYSVVRMANGLGPCMKVVFPLPKGSATVLLRPEAVPDGSLLLLSEGRCWADVGFYRILDPGGGVRWVRYVRAFRESFHVYVDERGGLLTDHVFRFFRRAVVRFRYRMSS